MICQVCKTNPVTMPTATTCSLQCSCSLSNHLCDPISYKDVKERLDEAIADAKKWARKNSKVKE